MHVNMSKDVSLGDVEILPFSEKWLDGILDLAEEKKQIDPLYGGSSKREETKSHIFDLMARGITKAYFVAVHKGEVVGSAKANVVPLCGKDEKKMAWISMHISLDRIGQGIGARLVDAVCREMRTQGVTLVRIGMLDAWNDWCRFLSKCGFKPNEDQRTVDAVLPSNAQLPSTLPLTDVSVRPIRLPEDKQRVLDFDLKELAQNLPHSCSPQVGKEAWWEMNPNFDPSGFLIAEDKNTGKIVGYVNSYVMKSDKGDNGIIEVDVSSSLAATRLRDSLVVQGVNWLREKGVKEVKFRIHVGYKNEEETFKRLGFNLTNSASIWYKTT